jgi:hypothetical protein
MQAQAQNLMQYSRHDRTSSAPFLYKVAVQNLISTQESEHNVLLPGFLAEGR